jgi:hypothetical protein
VEATHARCRAFAEDSCITSSSERRHLKRKFGKEVLRLRPTWRAVPPCFFCMLPVELIACGFAWEKSRGGLFISRYAHPLFDRGPSLSLGLGQRLASPDDFLTVAPGNEQVAASDFIKRVASQESDVSRLQDPPEFLSYIESLNSFRNPWVRRAYAMTLIVLGRTAEAAAQVNVLLKNEPIDNLPEFRADMTLVANTLSENPSAMLSMLQKRAAENRRALGLELDNHA